MRLLRCTTVVALACLPGIAVSQTEPRPAGLERLQYFVGHWSSTGEMRADPGAGFEPLTGDETCSWAAGAHAVLCQEKAESASGGWEGVYILSYDAASDEYHVYGTETPGGNMHAVGRLDGDAWIWFTDPAPDGSRARYTFTSEAGGDRKMVVEVGAGDDWTRVVTIDYAPRD